MEIYGVLINSIWTILQNTLYIGTFQFTIWQFLFTCILIGIAIRLVRKNLIGGNEE